MGGAIAGPKQWGEHRQKWKETLCRYSVNVLHMTDCENRQGEFRGWDENRKRRFLSDLIGSFNENTFFLIGAAAVVQDFNRLPFRADKKFGNLGIFAIKTVLCRPFLLLTSTTRNMLEWRRSSQA